MKYLIYGLVDPRTKAIRYIGKSSSGLSRPRRHRAARELQANTRCCTWIKSLHAAGTDYDTVVLQELRRESQLNAAERRWIQCGLALGWRLTNHTAGGDGCSGYRQSAASNQSRSTKLNGRVFSEAHRRRISEAKRGVPKARAHRGKLKQAMRSLWAKPEYRKHQVEAHTGFKQDREVVAKRTAKLIGSKRSKATRRRMSAAQHRRNANA